MGDDRSRSVNRSIFNRSTRMSPSPKKIPTEFFAESGGGGNQSLILSLKILQRYQTAHSIKNSGTVVESKKGNAFVQSSQSYVFTSGMFSRSNTDALVEVTYQILSTIHPKETFTKFRTCYPPNGDRKVESEYRKIAWTWIHDEICQKYPQFFEGSKPQFAYFVTPSGPKCVRFLAALANCAMFVLAERIQAAKGKTVPDNPKFESPNSSVGSIARITDATEAITRDGVRLMKQMSQLVIYMEQKQKDRVQEDADTLQIRLSLESRVRDFILKRPELFPSNSFEVLHSTDRLKVKDGRAFDEDMVVYPSTDDELEDKLLPGVNQEWSQGLMGLRESYETIGGFFAQYKPLMELLDKIAEHDVIDVTKYPGIMPKRHGSDPAPDVEVGQCLVLSSNFAAIQALFCASVNANGDLMGRIDKTVKAQVARANELAKEASSALTIAKTPRVNKDDILFRIQLDEMATQGVDWDALLPKTSVKATDVNNALALTPVKPRDFNRTTGLTPNFDCGIRIIGNGQTASTSRMSQLMDAIRISGQEFTATGNTAFDGDMSLGNESSVIYHVRTSDGNNHQDLEVDVEGDSLDLASQNIARKQATPLNNDFPNEVGILEDSFRLSFVSISSISP